MRPILQIPFALLILLSVTTIPHSALGCGCQQQHSAGCPSSQNQATDTEFTMALPSVYEPGVDCDVSENDQAVPVDPAGATDTAVMRSSLAKDTMMVADMRPQPRATAARLADFVY